MRTFLWQNLDQSIVLLADPAGIRRSTRQRKLKYENYSDSWIVGAQTLRGYPQNNYVDLRDVYNSPYPRKQGDIKIFVYNPFTYTTLYNIGRLSKEVLCYTMVVLYFLTI